MYCNKKFYFQIKDQKNHSILILKDFHFFRFSLALEEAQTVDRIIGTLGEKAIEALAIESPFLGKQSSHKLYIKVYMPITQ